jgi:hypothetical protein
MPGSIFGKRLESSGETGKFRESRGHNTEFFASSLLRGLRAKFRRSQISREDREGAKIREVALWVAM